MSELGEGPGEALKSAREALNVSEREVADALNLPLSVIDAMEANDYQQLPPAVFTRGYLRSYARLLELDPDEIVASFPVSEEDDVTGLTGEVAVVSTPSLLTDKRAQLIAGTAIAVVLVIILIVALSSSTDEAVVDDPAADRPEPESVLAQADQVQADPAVISAAESDPGDAAPASVESAIPSVPAAQPDVEAAETEPDDAAEAAAPGVSSSEPVTAGSPGRQAAVPDEDAEIITDPTPAGMRRITPFGDDVLTMSFSEDCWVDIKDRDGASLYEDLIRGGRTIVLIGDAPFRVLLGYAPGAKLSFNGEAVDVAGRTRNNVARLTVGN